MKPALPFAARRLAECPVPLYVTYGDSDGERVGLERVPEQIPDGRLPIDLDGRRILVHHSNDWCGSGDTERAEIVELASS